MYSFERPRGDQLAVSDIHIAAPDPAIRELSFRSRRRPCGPLCIRSRSRRSLFPGCDGWKSGRTARDRSPRPVRWDSHSRSIPTSSAPGDAFFDQFVNRDEPGTQIFAQLGFGLRRQIIGFQVSRHRRSSWEKCESLRVSGIYGSAPQMETVRWVEDRIQRTFPIIPLLYSRVGRWKAVPSFPPRWNEAMKKCMRCSKPATLHITEIQMGQAQVVHLCETCAQKYLSSVEVGGVPAMPDDDEAENEAEAELAAEEAEEAEETPSPTCSGCGITFKQFRSVGRMGCSRCYSSFHDELVPLLESIHRRRSMWASARRRPPKVRCGIMS